MSRMSKERMDKAQEQLKTISAADYAKVKALAAIVRSLRSRGSPIRCDGDGPAPPVT
jgi:hypothetical protein